MKKKEFLLKTLSTLLIVASAAIVVPGINTSLFAAGTNKSYTYKSIEYGEGDEAVKTISETGRTISSTGVLADNTDYTKASIYLDTDDYKIIAHLINEFNREVSSTDASNNRSFNNAIANKNVAKKLFKKVGYNTDVSVSSVKIDGFDKASETKALSEKVLKSIR